MSAPFVSEAIVLRSVDTGEADRVVTLLTRARGKLAAVARAARKSRKRFGGALALFVLGDAELVERRASDLYALERFDARKDHPGIAADVVKLAHASYGTELLGALTPVRQADPRLLDLALELYGVVEATTPRASTLRAFELALLDEIGFAPVLDRCASCHEERAPAAIDPAVGGVLCAACAPRARGPGSAALSPEALARLCALRGLPLAAAAALAPAPPEVERAAREAMHALVRAHVHGPLRTLDFVEQLRGGA